MQPDAKQLFRPEALDRLNSPESLDQVMRVVKPRAWLSLLAIGLISGSVGLWSVYGRIPLSVTGQGILIKPRQVVQLQSSSAGQLQAVPIAPGDVVEQGDVIGILDQSALQQRLQQAQAKLSELQNQDQSRDRLQQQLMSQELAALQQQRQHLEATLQREQLGLELTQQTQGAIAAKRASLTAQQQQVGQLLQTLQARVSSRQQLVSQQVVSRDTLVQAEQDYASAQAQATAIDVQLKDLEIQATSARQSDLQRQNQIDQMQTQLQTLMAQETKLREQTLKQSIDRTNEIQDLKRQIDQLQLQLAQSGNVLSPQSGRILEVSLAPGQMVSPGTRIGAIEVEDRSSELVGYAYLNNEAGKQVQPGMTVQVTPSFTKRERYGGMVGTVTNVSPFALTPQAVAVSVGNEAIANHLTQQGVALMQITVRLEPDPSTASGYRWSSQEGRSIALSSGTTTTVQVQVGDRAPISYLLPIVRSALGMGR